MEQYRSRMGATIIKFVLSQAASAHDQLHDLEDVLSHDFASISSGDFGFALLQLASAERVTSGRILCRCAHGTHGHAAFVVPPETFVGILVREGMDLFA